MRRSPSPLVILIVAGIGVFVGAVDLTVVTTMVRPIIGDLGIVLPDGLDDAAWIVNAYLIAYVAVMPFAGRLSDVVGRRKVFIGALALFVIGSLIIPRTSSLGPFLVGRVLTAIGGGALVPVGLAVIGDVYPPGRRARVLGILGSVETLGWVWGPLFGAFLVRFLSWHWQFHINVPLGLIAIAVGWWAFAAHDRPQRSARIDWLGAGTLTGFLVALNLALLGSAEIQSVTGLDELTGGGGGGFVWFYLVAVVALVGFVIRERRTDQPLIDFDLFAGRNLTAAVAVNFFMGAALIIAMVDVPLFVNVVELDVERSAVIAGGVLSALTATMALTSYLGGRITDRLWYRPPVVGGLAGAAVALLVMGFTWDADSAYPMMAAQLAVLGAGLGLVIAPTTAAVVDAAAPDRRGTAAGLVIMVRLIGLSVGLSGLTAWGLYRFNQLRGNLDLPPLGTEGYEEALRRAQTELTTSSLAETFLAAAVLAAVGMAVAMFMRRDRSPPIVEPGEEAPVGGSLPPSGPPGSMAVKEDPEMKQFLSRPLPWLRLGLMAAVTVLFVAVIALAVRIGSLGSEIDTLREDMERVESGAAIYASQMTAFQTQLGELAPTVGSALGEAIAGLDQFRTSTLEIEIPIDQTIPIEASLPINETIETTITVDGPFGLEIPVGVTVPVDVTVPIETEVPIRLNVPIEIPVAGTELATLAESLQQGLEGFAEVLEGLGG